MRGDDSLECITIHCIKLYAIRVNNPAEFYNSYCISDEDKTQLKIYTNDDCNYNMVVIDVSTDIRETTIKTNNMKSILKDRIQSEYIKVAMQEIHDVQISVHYEDIDDVMDDIFVHIVNMASNRLSVSVDDYVYTSNIINNISVSMSFRETIYCGLNINNMSYLQNYMYDHGFLEKNTRTMYDMINYVPIMDVRMMCIIYINYKTNCSLFKLDNIYLKTISIYINNVFLNIYNSFISIGETMFYDIEIIEAIFLLCNAPCGYDELYRTLICVLFEYELCDSVDLIEHIQLFVNNAEDVIAVMSGDYYSDYVDISYTEYEVYFEFLAYKLLKLNNRILIGRL